MNKTINKGVSLTHLKSLSNCVTNRRAKRCINCNYFPKCIEQYSFIVQYVMQSSTRRKYDTLLY